MSENLYCEHIQKGDSVRLLEAADRLDFDSDGATSRPSHGADESDARHE